MNCTNKLKLFVIEGLGILVVRQERGCANKEGGANKKQFDHGTFDFIGKC